MRAEKVNDVHFFGEMVRSACLWLLWRSCGNV